MKVGIKKWKLDGNQTGENVAFVTNLTRLQVWKIYSEILAGYRFASHIRFGFCERSRAKRGKLAELASLRKARELAELASLRKARELIASEAERSEASSQS